jgi:putative copper export protein
VAAALLLALAALGEALRLAAVLTGGVPSPAALMDLLGGSRVGGLLLARLLLTLALVAWRPWLPGRTPAGLVLGGGLLTTFGLASHAGAGREAGALLAELVHLSAAAAWYGGLVAFALVPWRALEGPDGRAVLERATQRFSRLGLFAMALLAVTGASLALLHLHGRLDLAAHAYGRTLLVKLAFLAGVLALAGANRFRVRPGLAAGEAEAAQRLRRLVVAEALCGLGVLGAAGALATTPPPG